MGSVMKGKTCRICNKDLPLESFTLTRNECKPCASELTKNRYRTKEGMIKRAYQHMKRRVEGRHTTAISSVGKELLDFDVFYKWSINNFDYHFIWTAWTDSGRMRRLTPSVDRIDKDKGYTLDNMEWVTVAENTRRENRSRLQ